MQIKVLPIAKIKANPKNPRIIRDEKYRTLLKSVQDFPEMLQKRPLVVFTDTDKKFVVLGGNMRLKAATELGLKELPVIIADDWTEEQKNQFLIKDNISAGDWDWTAINNEFSTEDLTDWGLDVWQTPAELDYSILQGEDLSQELTQMTSGVKKSIQIEFEHEHYEEAYELVKFWREQKLYIGGFLMEKLQEEKSKL